MAEGFTVKDAADFQDYSGRVGLSNQNTATSRMAAMQQVFAILPPEDHEDVRMIDIDSAFAKWVNKNGTKYTPASMQVYLSRTKTAVSDFLRYKADPSAFKPAAPSIGRSTTGKASGKDRA